MRLIPYSKAEPEKIGTVARLTMRCGHEQTCYSAVWVTQGLCDIEAWAPGFRASMKAGLRAGLENLSRTQDCSACESAKANGGAPFVENG